MTTSRRNFYNTLDLIGNLNFNNRTYASFGEREIIGPFVCTDIMHWNVNIIKHIRTRV